MSNERRVTDVNPIAGQDAIPGLGAWVAANRGRLKRESINRLLVMHDHGCRFPWGEPCTCRPGPEIRVTGEDAGCN